MKEEIYHLSSDICHLSLEDTESLGILLMTDDRPQFINLFFHPSSFILQPFFTPTHR